MSGNLACTGQSIFEGLQQVNSNPQQANTMHTETIRVTPVDDNNEEKLNNTSEEPSVVNDEETQPVESAERRQEKAELLAFIFGETKDEAAKQELLDRYAQLNIEDFYMVLQNNIAQL